MPKRFVSTPRASSPMSLTSARLPMDKKHLVRRDHRRRLPSDASAATCPARPTGTCGQQEFHALLFQLPLEHAAQLRSVGPAMWSSISTTRDLRARRGVAGDHLQPDDAAADDRQPVRHLRSASGSRRFVATKPPRFSRTPGISGTTADEPVAISSRAAV